jgi:hypothetical protein
MLSFPEWGRAGKFQILAAWRWLSGAFATGSVAKTGQLRAFWGF